jgi:hypothetical protein
MKSPERIAHGVADFVRLLRVFKQLESDGFISEKEFDHAENGIRRRVLDICGIRLTAPNQEIFTYVNFDDKEKKSVKQKP